MKGLQTDDQVIRFPRASTPLVIKGDAALRLSTLVGRDRDLAQLEKALAHPPGFVLIEGEAGIGKTRLVKEFAARAGAAGDRIMWGACRPMTQPMPLAPFVESIRSLGAFPAIHQLSPLCGFLRYLLPELSERLPPLPPGLTDSQSHYLFRALEEMLDVVAPAALVIEDLHWADRATLDLLAFLTSSPSADGLNLIVTYRREELSVHRASWPLGPQASSAERTTIVLRPLSLSDVGDLVSSILHTPDVSQQFVTYLHEKTAGIPLAVEEALRLLKDRRDIVQHEGEWKRRQVENLHVPASVSESVLGRLSGLSPIGHAVVTTAAVAGNAVNETMLREVTGFPASDVAKELGEAMNAVLLIDDPEGGTSFKHDLVRQTVYDSLPSPVRRQLHSQIARWLERNVPDEFHLIAEHFRRSGETSSCFHYLEKAADIALAENQNALAAQLLMDAPGAEGLTQDMRGRLVIKFARAALEGLEQNEAAELVRRVLDGEDLSQAVRGELRFWLGVLLLQAGDPEGRAEIERSISDLDQLPHLQVRAMSTLAWPSWTAQGSRDEHLTWLVRAEELATESDAITRIFVTVERRYLDLINGRPGAGHRAEETPDPTGDPAYDRHLIRAGLNLGHAALHAGRYDLALRLMHAGLNLCGDLLVDRHLSGLTCLEPMIDWCTGKWDGLEDRVRALRDDPQRLATTTSEMELILAGLEIARGATKSSAFRLEEAIRELRRVGDFGVLGFALEMQARVASTPHEHERAASDLRWLLEICVSKGAWAWVARPATAFVRLLLSAGDLEEAEATKAVVDGGVGETEIPVLVAAADLIAGLIAERKQESTAPQLLADACSRFVSMGAPYEAALTEERRGSCLASLDQKGWEEALISALKTFEDLGATWDASRVRRTMRSLGMKVPRPGRSGPKGYGTELSPREIEVTRLAAEGATNSEIAAALFLSPKTVEHHMGRAMRKLGVASRRALIPLRESLLQGQD